MPGRKPCWSRVHFREVNRDGKPQLQCIHCDMYCSPTGTRCRGHLAVCTKCTTDVANRAKGVTSQPAAAPLQLNPTDTPVTSATTPTMKRTREEPPQKQSRLAVCPGLSQIEKDNLREKIGRWVYAGGLPFSVVEDPLFLEMLQAVRPNLKATHLPSRHSVGTTMLEKEYERVRAPLEEAIKKTKELSLQVDAWTAKHGDKCFAAMASSGEEEPMLVHSGVLKEKSHNASELFHHLQQTPAFVQDRLVCLLTDGDATAVKAMKMLKEQNPALYTLVCACHTLARAVNDCVGTKTVKGREAKNEFAEMGQRVTTLVSRIRNVEYLQVRFDEIAQQLKKPRRLVLPAVTRWTTFSDVWGDIQLHKETLLLLKEDSKVRFFQYVWL